MYRSINKQLTISQTAMNQPPSGSPGGGQGPYNPAGSSLPSLTPSIAPYNNATNGTVPTSTSCTSTGYITASTPFVSNPSSNMFPGASASASAQGMKRK